MLAPLRRCVDGWPCMVGDLRGRKMRTGSKIENPSTSVHGESRELQLLLFNFLCNLNRAPYKWAAKKWVTSPAPPLYRYTTPGSCSYMTQGGRTADERVPAVGNTANQGPGLDEPAKPRFGTIEQPNLTI